MRRKIVFSISLIMLFSFLIGGCSSTNNPTSKDDSDLEVLEVIESENTSSEVPIFDVESVDYFINKDYFVVNYDNYEKHVDIFLLKNNFSAYRFFTINPYEVFQRGHDGILKSHKPRKLTEDLFFINDYGAVTFIDEGKGSLAIVNREGEFLFDRTFDYCFYDDEGDIFVFRDSIFERIDGKLKERSILYPADTKGNIYGEIPGGKEAKAFKEGTSFTFGDYIFTKDKELINARNSPDGEKVLSYYHHHSKGNLILFENYNKEYILTDSKYNIIKTLPKPPKGGDRAVIDDNGDIVIGTSNSYLAEFEADGKKYRSKYYGFTPEELNKRYFGDIRYFRRILEDDSLGNYVITDGDHNIIIGEEANIIDIKPSIFEEYFFEDVVDNKYVKVITQDPVSGEEKELYYSKRHKSLLSPVEVINNALEPFGIIIDDASKIEIIEDIDTLYGY
jgi:hypothetical protein